MNPKDSTATEQNSNEQSQPESNNQEQETELENQDGNSEEQSAEEGEQPEGEAQTESFTSLDPAKLPKELKEVYKNMQADFTRKSQELSEARKKAQLYDQLQQEQIIQTKFPKIEDKARPSTETTQFLAQSLGVDVSQLAGEERQQLEFLAKLVDAGVQRGISQHVKPIQSDLLKRDYQAELADVKKKYADFNDYLPDIKSVLEANPQLSYEQAYRLASFDDRERKGRNSALKNLEVKKKQASPKASAVAQESDEPKSDFDSIFKWAKRKLNS